jgi:phosphoribosyl-AMP cyclohydrolase
LNIFNPPIFFIRNIRMTNIIDSVKFDEKGLVLAIAQDAETNMVLMVAYMNRDTLLETLTTGKMVYYSRSRKKRWLKGETSGHFQTVKSVFIDCDGDALLFKINQKGAACHEGYFSCFFREKENDAWIVVGDKK